MKQFLAAFLLIAVNAVDLEKGSFGFNRGAVNGFGIPTGSFAAADVAVVNPDKFFGGHGGQSIGNIGGRSRGQSRGHGGQIDSFIGQGKSLGRHGKFGGNRRGSHGRRGRGRF